MLDPVWPRFCYSSFFFFNDTATTEIYTLSLHDALPISQALARTRESAQTAAPHPQNLQRESDLWIQPAPPPRDRKSTRLNSSHDQISYAVFCLKKKSTPMVHRRLLYSARAETGADGPAS